MKDCFDEDCHLTESCKMPSVLSASSKSLQSRLFYTLQSFLHCRLLKPQS